MKQEFIYGIPILVVIALVAAIASDYCHPFSIPEENTTLSIPSTFDPFCYIADFKPEAPELQTNNSLPQHFNVFTVSATGTAIGNPSISVGPSSPLELLKA